MSNATTSSFVFNSSDANAVIETVDFDLSRNDISESRANDLLAAKSKAIDVSNYMIRHNMSQVVFKNTSRNPVPSLVERLCIAHLSLFGETSNLMEERQMILMQGVPGSGKSSIATIIANHINAKVVSNDYYMVKNNKYCFEPARLNECIEKCQDDAERYAEEGWNLIVDNVNAEPFTVDYYFDLAERHNYRVMVIRTSRSSNECFRENIHNVPPQSIINMHGRMSELMN